MNQLPFFIVNVIVKKCDNLDLGWWRKEVKSRIQGGQIQDPGKNWTNPDAARALEKMDKGKTRSMTGELLHL
ncbi:MAG: hypothetical protein F4026_00110 [Synechococcus sp. SB0669_bin_8]|nr:hypothetical protein [Synechococcus sp. SB0669_bin_8]